MRFYVTLSLLLSLIVVPFAAAENTALVPIPRPDQIWNNKGGETWMGRHEGIKATRSKKDVDLIFVGDSITHGWDTTGTGTKIWQQVYEPFNAVNMGFGGDRTEHVLWRFNDGELDGISPKVAVVMIGTNNWRANTFQEIAEGVEAVCEGLRTRLPKTKILLLAIFPRVSSDPWAGANVVMANRLIEKLDDGKWINFLDIGSTYRDKKGRLPQTIMPDGLHPNEAGYEIWAEAIRPKLSELMGVDIPKYKSGK
jgi:lysophospholipase L1-like esterase|tara:strand:- start:267 stop:1025 length:759 start_codon:yes stop_codon:yes gene_type:complete